MTSTNFDYSKEVAAQQYRPFGIENASQLPEPMAMWPMEREAYIKFMLNVYAAVYVYMCVLNSYS